MFCSEPDHVIIMTLSLFVYFSLTFIAGVVIGIVVTKYKSLKD